MLEWWVTSAVYPRFTGLGHCTSLEFHPSPTPTCPAWHGKQYMVNASCQIGTQTTTVLKKKKKIAVIIYSESILEPTATVNKMVFTK